MVPQKVSAWREDLPYPFNQARPTLKGTTSEWHGERLNDIVYNDTSSLPRKGKRRSGSSNGALEGSDRIVSWLRYLRKGREERDRLKQESALRRLKKFVQPLLTQKLSRRVKFY